MDTKPLCKYCSNVNSYPSCTPVIGEGNIVFEYIWGIERVVKCINYYPNEEAMEENKTKILESMSINKGPTSNKEDTVPTVRIHGIDITDEDFQRGCTKSNYNLCLYNPEIRKDTAEELYRRRKIPDITVCGITFTDSDFKEYLTQEEYDLCLRDEYFRGATALKLLYKVRKKLRVEEEEEERLKKEEEEEEEEKEAGKNKPISTSINLKKQQRKLLIRKWLCIFGAVAAITLLVIINLGFLLQAGLEPSINKIYLWTIVGVLMIEISFILWFIVIVLKSGKRGGKD